MISQKTKDLLSYILAIVCVGLGSFVLVFLARGNQYDPLRNTVSATGLVLINSQPGGAAISLNDRGTSQKTPYRYENAAVGSLSIALSRADYRNWKSAFRVLANEVTFADYAFLVAQNLKYTELTNDVQFSSVVSSFDRRRHFGLSRKPVALWQLEDEKLTRLYLPTTDPTAPEKTITDLSDLQLTNDGGTVLFRQTEQSGAISNLYLSLGSSPQNLSQQFQFGNARLYLNPQNGRELFWLESGNLRKINMDSRTASAVLQSGIIDFSIARDRLFATQAASEGSPGLDFVSLNFSGNDKKVIDVLDRQPAGYELSFVKGQFNSYAYALGRNTHQLSVWRDPLGNDRPKSTFGQVLNASFSPTGRFLITNRSGLLRTYDMEFGQVHDFRMELPGLLSWQWFNDYHILVIDQKGLRLSDFDGQNSYALQKSDSQPVSTAELFSEKSIYYVGSNGLLQKVDLQPQD